MIQTNTSPTLDVLFKRILARRPDALALVDPLDKPRVTGQPAKRLSFAEADRAITALAAHFIEAGLPRGVVLLNAQYFEPVRYSHRVGNETFILLENHIFDFLAQFAALERSQLTVAGRRRWFGDIDVDRRLRHRRGVVGTTFIVPGVRAVRLSLLGCLLAGASLRRPEDRFSLPPHRDLHKGR